VGLIGTGPDGGSVGQVCSGKQFTSMTATVVCESGGTVTCPPGQTACGPDGGQTCVNLQTDVNNCGSCGNVCAAGDTCTAGVCKVPPPTICTATGQTNCVSCPGNQHGGTCTKTEADIVQLDLNSGAVTAAGPDNAGCYACLQAAFCLDDSVTSGAECDDVAGNFTNGSSASVPFTGTCLATLECVIGSTAAVNGGTGPNSEGAECALPGTSTTGDHGDGQSFCYCGTNGGASSACGGVTNQNGSCLSQEVAGFNTTTASTILNNFTNTAEPSGLANNLVACALANSCTMCLSQ
jgi:hypothetical protein